MDKPIEIHVNAKGNNKKRNEIKSIFDEEEEGSMFKHKSLYNNEEKSEKQIKILNENEGKKIMQQFKGEEDSFDTFMTELEHTKPKEVQSKDVELFENEDDPEKIKPMNIIDEENVHDEVDKSVIQLLDPLDYSKIVYPDKLNDVLNDSLVNGYKIEDNEIDGILRWNLMTSTIKPTCILRDFNELSIPESLQKRLKELNIIKPTPIQQIVIPFVLQCKNVVAVSETGSGKTLSFGLPIVIRNSILSTMKKECPYAIIIEPTKELAHQVAVLLAKIANPIGLRVMEISANCSVYEKVKEVKHHLNEIIVATPGKLIEVIRKGGVMNTVEMVCIDEADKMVNMGFIKQIECILSQIRPDAQMILCTATCDNKLKEFITKRITNSVQVTIQKEKTLSINETFIKCKDDNEKKKWLITSMKQYKDKKVLIFVNSKLNANAIEKMLSSATSMKILLLHGDKTYEERNEVIKEFRMNKSILIATDIVARGIDINDIEVIINYESNGITNHIHRIGRTSRLGGINGQVITLLTSKDYQFVTKYITYCKSNHKEVDKTLSSFSYHQHY